MWGHTSCHKKYFLLTFKGNCMNFSLELIFFMLCHPVTSKQPHKIVQILVGHPLYQNGPFLGNTRTKASNSSLICLRLTLGGGRVWKQWSFQASTYCFSVKLHQLCLAEKRSGSWDGATLFFCQKRRKWRIWVWLLCDKTQLAEHLWPRKKYPMHIWSWMMVQKSMFEKLAEEWQKNCQLQD